VTNAVPGDPAVPVNITVTSFNNIGKFTLTLKFDTLKVRYVSATTNTSLNGMTVTYTAPSGNTLGKLVLAWTGTSNISLDDGSAIAGLVFRYVNGTGILNWEYTYGSVCRYQRWVGGVLTTLADNPKYIYYLNGGISGRGAPVTIAPVIEDPVAGPVYLPVTVNNFTDVGGFTLYLEYDPAYISYASTFTKNPVFDFSFQVGDNPGFNGKRHLVIQWFGSPVNLSEGDTMCMLTFNYLAAQCNHSMLSWYDNGPTCEYSDGTGNMLIDMPQPSYYVNGLVQPGLPVTWTGNFSNAWDDPGNWSACGTPDNTRNVVIPDVSPNAFPVITSTTYCRSIEIQPGATVTVSSAGMVVVGD